MIYLPPVKLTLGEQITYSAKYREDGDLFDFTGYTGTWALTQRGSNVASGNLTLSASGDITVSFTAAQIAALQTDATDRGFTLGGAQFTATATNGTKTLNFTAAVQLFRNRTNE